MLDILKKFQMEKSMPIGSPVQEKIKFLRENNFLSLI